MSTAELRCDIKKMIDRLPVDRLVTVADFVSYLNCPSLIERIEAAEADLKIGKGTKWRKVRRDVWCPTFAGTACLL